ncbi:hypothetical protein Tco_0707272 [Tanacetum coccineum]|uniref:Uncharacterized protein n=1 Tax=Tanacetum coccineum TaxID=301880 RepID=A0ABQ4YBC8_9ASTR
MMRKWIVRQMKDHVVEGKGDVKFFEEDKIKPNPTMPNLNPINSNPPTVSPFLKDFTMLTYTNAKTFANVVLPNHVGDKDLKSIDGVGNRVLTKKEKDDKEGSGEGGCLEVKLIDLTRLC